MTGRNVAAGRNRAGRCTIARSGGCSAAVELSGWVTGEKEAVAWLRDPANPWDIAIVDLVLEPGRGSGFGVLQAMRDRPATRKMIVLTGSANPQVRRHCEQMGADGVFDKAMETDAMLDYCAALSRAAGGH